MTWPQQHRWIRRVVVVAIISAPVYLIASAVREFGQSTHLPQRSFDQSLWSDSGFDDNGDELHTNRQSMIVDLTANILPSRSREQIESLLGPSCTHEEMRRYTMADLQIRERDANGEWKPFPRTGEGHYYDDYDWDMAYYIGYYRTPDPAFLGSWEWESEILLIRLSPDDRFESWYLVGAPNWSNVLSPQAAATFQSTR